MSKSTSRRRPHDRKSTPSRHTAGKIRRRKQRQAEAWDASRRLAKQGKKYAEAFAELHGRDRE